MSETEDTHHKLGTVVEQTNLRGRQASRLEEEFASEASLVDYLESGESLTDLSGIGDKTARKVIWWFESEHPEAHRRMRDNDESVFTDFETEKDACGSESADGEPVWGAYCPQGDCGHLNLFEGDPDGFAGRPCACQNCHWVSLMAPRVSNLEVLG